MYEEQRALNDDGPAEAGPSRPHDSGALRRLAQGLQAGELRELGQRALFGGAGFADRDAKAACGLLDRVLALVTRAEAQVDDGGLVGRQGVKRLADRALRHGALDLVRRALTLDGDER